MTAILAHELSGPEDAPVLVLSCSIGTDRTMWDPQVGPLSERFRVLRYDLRGHGASPVTAGPYAIADLADDLLDLLDRLQIEAASLCGMSIGGMISMWIAAHAPERVRRLIVCCSTAHFDPPVSDSYRWRAGIVRDSGLAPIADQVVDRWFAQPHPETTEHMRRVLEGTAREGYAACCDALADMELRPELHMIRAPTLVIAGADDHATPLPHSQAIASTIDGARLEVIAGAAHLANLDQSEAFTRLVLEFLTEEAQS